MNPQPKPKKLHDKKYLKWLADQQPLIPGHGDTVYHHLKLLGGGGMSTKPPDDHAIPIADSVHRDLHNYGERRVLCEKYGYSVESLRDIAAAYYRIYSRGEDPDILLHAKL